MIPSTATAAPSSTSFAVTVPRDPGLRRLYLDAALGAVPRLLASVDRNPFSPTYGCCDRQYWHYRTAAFPSEMYQETALPLAIAYARPLPGSRWHGEMRLAEAAVAAMRFSARSAHADGSCDDYYPFERALGAAVFSLQAQAEAYRLLGLDDPVLRRHFQQRAQWIAEHDESGRLTNHHALAGLALWRTGKLTGDFAMCDVARRRVEQVVAWQSAEGWFDEYGGADPGYQTVTIDCLARLRKLDDCFAFLDAPLRRATAFARRFLHLDDSYGGEYGSRGTRHFYPHGFELAAGDDACAADLADGHLRALETGFATQFADDRMCAHPVASYFDAYCDWSPQRPPVTATQVEAATLSHFASAGLVVRNDAGTQAIVSTARGGSFHWRRRSVDRITTHVDAGLVVECSDGRVAVSQAHDAEQLAEVDGREPSPDLDVSLERSLTWVRFRRASPWTQAILHLGMVTVGRFARDLVRRALQRKVVRGGGSSPIRLTRHLRTIGRGEATRLVVTDVVELTDPQVQVERLAYASDLQAAYTAACEVFQPAMLQPWSDLRHYVAELNRERRVVIIREL